ncbi:MAG: hypothetical protein RI885_178 [Actinomycetota bacterium]
MDDRAADVSIDSVIDGVGPRLRALRLRRGLTLAELAGSTGISVSTLSRLESGGRRATLELLLPLAKQHGVPLDELVGAPEVGDPRVRLRPLKRHGQIIVPLSREGGGLQAFKHLLAAGPRDEHPQQASHEGFEWLYILSGRLRLVLGDHDLELTRGEAVEFDTRTPHWFGRADERAVEFLTLFGRQRERMHVRARPKKG